jgi:hypothetical protein
VRTHDGARRGHLQGPLRACTLPTREEVSVDARGPLSTAEAGAFFQLRSRARALFVRPFRGEGTVDEWGPLFAACAALLRVGGPTACGGLRARGLYLPWLARASTGPLSLSTTPHPLSLPPRIHGTPSARTPSRRVHALALQNLCARARTDFGKEGGGGGGV